LIGREPAEGNSDLIIEALEHRNTIQAILRFIYIPIALLVVLILVTLIVHYFGISSVMIAMPTVITLCGFGVAFTGAFWDFGARKYLNSLANSRIMFTDKDVTRINKQQLQLTLIFLGIAGLYVLTAAFIYLFL
jgi:hypothetical protein